MATAPWEASASSDERVFLCFAWCLEAWGSLAAVKSGSILAGTSRVRLCWISLAAALGPSALSDGMEQARWGLGGQPPPAVPDVKAGREGGFEY